MGMPLRTPIAMSRSPKPESTSGRIRAARVAAALAVARYHQGLPANAANGISHHGADDHYSSDSDGVSISDTASMSEEDTDGEADGYVLCLYVLKYHS